MNVTLSPRVPARTLVGCLVVLLAGWPASAAPLRTLWVDHASRGGPCSDSYSAAENAAANGAKPWCTLGAAGEAVRAGDQVTVRGGTYSERMTCGINPNCSGACVLELVKKGTAANPIVYKAYPGEIPTIDPAGAIPTLNSPHGLVFGVCAGIVAPTGLCRGGSRDAQDCTTDDGNATTGCPGTSCPNCCDRSPSYHTVLDGFRFSNWKFWDQSMNASNASHIPSQYAVYLHVAVGTVSDVTIRHSEFVGNNGGGALHAHGTARVTFEYNTVHDNWTHGWTSAVNFWNAAGKNEGANVIRGNVIHDNQDDPPLFCLPKVCGGSTANTNPCLYDQYTNKVAARPQGYGCACGANSDCQSNQCVTRNCSDATGGCECAGDTEGHGLILDVAKGTCAPAGKPALNCGWAQDPVCASSCTGAGQPSACCTGPGAGTCCDPGDAGNFLIESNLIYDNEGNCMSIFKSDGATVLNNTCWRNQRRPSGGEVTAFTNRSAFWNNILVPRSDRTCWQSTNQGADCSNDPGICQGGSCQDKWALALYFQSSIFPIQPATNSEGANLMWSPSTQNMVQFGYGQAGTVAQFIAAGTAYGYGAGDLQQDPLFVNPSATPPDLHLQASSPAAGSANTAHLAPADVTGAIRTSADRGAYARSTEGPTTTSTTVASTTTTLPTGPPAAPRLLSVDPQ
jgi:hypothetical protein